MSPTSRNTPIVPDGGNTTARMLVAETMDEFTEEEPTKREISESLAETLERLRTEISPTERPSVRMKAITAAPENT